MSSDPFDLLIVLVPALAILACAVFQTLFVCRHSQRREALMQDSLERERARRFKTLIIAAIWVSDLLFLALVLLML